MFDKGVNKSNRGFELLSGVVGKVLVSIMRNDIRGREANREKLSRMFGD